MNKKAVARKIVDDIITDVTDRKGLRQEWEEIDEDIQEEIIDSWSGIAEKGIDWLGDE